VYEKMKPLTKFVPNTIAPTACGGSVCQVVEKSSTSPL
jgi:hypothetical protein